MPPKKATPACPTSAKKNPIAPDVVAPIHLPLPSQKDRWQRWEGKISRVIRSVLFFFAGGVLNHVSTTAKITYAALVAFLVFLWWEFYRRARRWRSWPGRPAALLAGSVAALMLASGLCIWGAITRVNFREAEDRRKGTRQEVKLSPDFVSELKTVLGDAKAEYSLNDGRTNNFRGVAVLLFLTLDPPVPGRQNFLFDRGRSLDRDRISIFLTVERKLCFRVIGKDGQTANLLVGRGLETFVFGSPMVLDCEYGTDGAKCFLEVSINGKVVGSSSFLSAPVVSEGEFGGSIGTDLNGKSGGVFSLFEVLRYGDTRTQPEQLRILDYFNRRLDQNPSAVHFDGTGRVQFAK